MLVFCAKKLYHSKFGFGFLASLKLKLWAFCGNLQVAPEYFILDKNMSKLKEFFKEYEVKMVIFLRRHDFWEESRYQQGLKTMVNPPWDPGIENFLKFHSKRSSNKYRYLVDKWALEFGSENIIVIPFEKQQNKPSLIETFLMRIDELSLYEKGNFKNRKLNTSLSFKACLLLEIFQRLEIDGTTRNKLISYAQTINRDEKKQTFLSNEMRRRVIEENQSDYEYIAKKYLNRADGRLFYEDIITDDDCSNEVKLTNEEIALHVVKALS